MANKVQKLSASQLATANGCLVKWAFSRTHKRDATQAMSRGHSVHWHVRQWCERRTPPDPRTTHGRTALAVLPHYPPNTYAEWTFGFSDEQPYTILGVPFRGGIDGLPENTGHQEHELLIDLKTTGDLMWAMTEQELLADPQRIVYTIATKRPRSRWIYVTPDTASKHSQVRVVEATEPLTRTYARYVECWHPLATRLIELGPKPDPMALAEQGHRNLSYCNRYGTCLYQAQCYSTLPPELRQKQLTDAILAAGQPGTKHTTPSP